MPGLKSPGICFLRSARPHDGARSGRAAATGRGRAPRARIPGARQEAWWSGTTAWNCSTTVPGSHGWAKQDGLPTVEGCLEEAFRTALGLAPLLRVAGRTDAGVHARRQVVSLWLPDEVDPVKLRRSLNALTPAGIAVLDVRRAPAAFDARRDATSRSYRYFVCADPVMSPFWSGYCWQVYGDGLDTGRMTEAAALVAGRHHFTAFTPTETKHVFFDRTVLRCRWTRAGGAALPAAVLGEAARRAAPGRTARACFAWRSRPTPFCATWCGPWWGPWSRSAGASGRSRISRGSWTGRTREAAGLTAPPPRAVPLGHQVRPRRHEAAALWDNPR